MCSLQLPYDLCCLYFSVVVLEESPFPRGSSRSNFQVLVLVLESQILDNNTGHNFHRVMTVLADRTAKYRQLASSCPPPVCPSVYNAVYCGSRGWCTGLKVVPACKLYSCLYNLQVSVGPFSRMYRLATKRTKIKSRKTRN